MSFTRSLIPLLLLLSACDSDRSTGGGGVRMFGTIDTGVTPRDAGNNRDGGGGGGGSGVDPNKFLDEVEPAEVTAICMYSIAQQGGPGMKTCGENTTITVRTQAECETSFGAGTNAPHCTVGLIDACMASLGGDACMLFSTQECLAFIQCASGPDPMPDAGEPDAEPADGGGS